MSEHGLGRFVVRDRLTLLYEAGAAVGTTLDVTRTAQELTQVVVPRFTDYAAVDLPDSVLQGGEPPELGTGLRRIAYTGIREAPSRYGVGALIKYFPATPHARSMAIGRPVFEPVLDTTSGWIARDPERRRLICRRGVHSLIAVPLSARGLTLGVVSFYRSRNASPFEDDDVALAEELVGRAAVCVDNARRYTHERAIATELEHATASLKQALERQRRFIADASHELRTPLAGLRTQLEEARLHPAQTDVTDLLDHVLRDVDRLQAIITDLLLLTRLGPGPPSAVEHLDLARLTVTETRSRPGGDPSILVHLTGDVPINGVPTQISRLLRNLLDNAQRHADHTVEIQVQRTDDTAELTVTDDGPGVPRAEHDHIFERFTRLDTARGRDHGGTGLGLAIARDIAHAHHGTLHVEDAHPHGACFVLRLPLAGAPAPLSPGDRGRSQTGDPASGEGSLIQRGPERRRRAPRPS